MTLPFKLIQSSGTTGQSTRTAAGRSKKPRKARKKQRTDLERTKEYEGQRQSMANVETATHEHGHGEGDHGHSHGEISHADHTHHEPSFFFKYIFSTDHKTIGKQFMMTGLIWFMIGG